MVGSTETNGRLRKNEMAKKRLTKRYDGSDKNREKGKKVSKLSRRIAKDGNNFGGKHSIRLTSDILRGKQT